MRSYSPTRAWTGERADQGRAGIIVGGGERKWDMRGSRLVWAVVSAMVVISAWLGALVVGGILLFLVWFYKLNYIDSLSLNPTAPRLLPRTDHPRPTTTDRHNPRGRTQDLLT